MKRFPFHILPLLLLIISQQLSAQETDLYKILPGSWLGRIPAGGINLRVVFNLKAEGRDSLSVTLESPDQGAGVFKIGPVIIEGRTINIKAPLLLGEYRGKVVSDTLIEGTWSQAGRTAGLNLAKLKRAFALNRPQEPKAPFPYKSEDISFRNEKAGIELSGTLTVPNGEGPFPAVVLVSGSGSQNRNEELLGHKPFWVIADHLSRNGIAVLRYDDRGVGKSKGTPLNATTADFATDAEAAFSYLLSRKEADPALSGIAGHSEGGLIAPMVASRNPKVAFIISLAGTGVRGEDILHIQNYDISTASGIDPDETRKAISLNKKLFTVLKKEADNKAAEVKMNALYRLTLEKEKKSQEEIEIALKNLNNSLNPVSFNWMRYFIITNPADFWKKVKCPVLALNGEKDLQVSAKVNLPAIEKALRKGGNNLVKTVSLPGLNHLFQHTATGLPSEYGDIEETISPEVLDIMTGWINKL
ncbi:MAG: alpha/beta hydrolase [Bacteroidales bacterium]|nr:alpha/beta hydrolase [Bacteroidales bacterium]